MTTTIQQLGRQAALMEKVSSTALVRAILSGALSSKSITRAATAMKPGQFRRLKQFDSGKFNAADLIVGNVGSHAGVGVRKLPTHKFVNPKQNYRGVKAESDRINKLLKRYNERPAWEASTPTQHPAVWPLVRQPIVPQAQVTGVGQAIAPYYHVGDRGAFQHFTGSLGGIESAPRIYLPGPKLGITGTTVHPQAHKYLSDLHPGNYGPGGQIHDFMSKRRPGIGSTMGYPGVKPIHAYGEAQLPQIQSSGWRPSKSWVPLPVKSTPSGSSLGSATTGSGLGMGSLSERKTLIHKWYDGMSQAQRASAPGYTPPLRPIREGIVDAWSSSRAGVGMDALMDKYPHIGAMLWKIKDKTSRLPAWIKRTGIPSRAP